ncbi:MAG: hypothetical protein U1F36_11965 [Planctomycetota bacterium]
MLGRLIAASCLALLNSFATAQEDLPRGRLLGVAQGAGGKPWEGATVHAREQGASLLDPSEIDAVEVRVGADGRFSLSILEGRPYAVWVSAPADGGRVLFSPVHEGARSGERVELHAESEPRAPRRLRIAAPEGVPAVPMHIEVRERILSRLTRVDATSGEAVLEAGPDTDATLIATDAAGHLVLHVDWSGGAGPGDEIVVERSAPRGCRVRVAEIGDKQPIAGATICAVVDGSLFPLATTDKDGMVVLDASFAFAHLAGEDAPDDASLADLVVRSEGHHLGLLTTPELPLLALREVGAEPTATCHPQPLEVKQCVVRLAIDGKPLPGASLFAPATAWESDGEGSMHGSEFELWFRSDDQGAIDLTGMRDGDEVLELHLGPAILRTLPAGWRKGLPDSIPLFLDPDQAAQSFALDLVRDLRVVDIEFLAATDGGPMVAAPVAVATADDHVASSLVADRVGRLRTLLPAVTKARIRFGTVDARGWCVCELDPDALAKDRERPLVIRPKLERPLRIDVALKAPQDVPATAEVFVSASFAYPGEMPEESADAKPTDGKAWRDLRGVAAILFCQHFPLHAERHGDDPRHWLLDVPALEGALELTATALHGDALYTADATVGIERDASTSKVELELVRQ